MATATLNTTPTTGDISMTPTESSGVQVHHESATSLSLNEKIFMLKHEVTVFNEYFAEKNTRYNDLTKEISKLNECINDCRKMLKEQKETSENKVLHSDCTERLKSYTQELNSHTLELQYFHTHIFRQMNLTREVLLNKYDSLMNKSKCESESMRKEYESTLEEYEDLRENIKQTATLNTTPTNVSISTTLVEPSGVRQDFESATNLSLSEKFLNLKNENEATALSEDFGKKNARYYYLMNVKIPELKNHINGYRDRLKEQEALKVRDEIKEQEMALEKKTHHLECNHILLRNFTTIIEHYTRELQKYEEELQSFHTHICPTYIRNWEALPDRYN
jgi:hypothetical protein